MANFLLDLRHALRALRRAPGFTTVAIATLALGVGANAAVFSIVDAVLLRPLPYLRPDRLVSVWGSTLGEFEALGQTSRSFRDVAAYADVSVNLTGTGEAERSSAAAVTPNLFGLLGSRPLAGRVFHAGEDVPGQGNVVILSYGLWQRRFASDPGILGGTISIDGAPRIVVGIMPADFAFPSRRTQLWIPVAIDRVATGAYWGSGGFQVVARLRDGVSLSQSRAEMPRVAAEVRHRNPLWDPGPWYESASHAFATPLRSAIGAAARAPLVALLAAVAVVLLVACANVANLLLVRGAARAKELAVRRALGAGRARLLRQVLTECALLAVASAASGAILATLMVRALIPALPSDLPRLEGVGVDGRVLAFALGVAVLVTLTVGLVPALRASRLDPRAAMQDGARGASGGIGHRRLAAAIVVGEIALAVVLVASAQLLIRSFRALLDVDTGFRTEQVMTARLSPSLREVESAPTASRQITAGTRTVQFYTDVLDRVRALPGVSAAEAASDVPLQHANFGIAVRIQGQFEDIAHSLPSADHYTAVTPGYFRLLGIPLVGGRAFTDADRPGAPGVVVVSQSFAHRFWPSESPLGKHIGYPWPGEWLSIVGVVADVKQDSLRGASEMAVYRPFAQQPSVVMSVVVRTSASDPVAVARSLRSVIAAVDPNVPVSDVATMRDVLSQSVAKPRFTTWLLGLFAALALLLGALGIYGVMATTVAQRQRELGIRLAVGATPRRVLWLVMQRAFALTGVGIVIGLGASVVAARLLSGLLYGVSTVDPWTVASVLTVLAAAAACASYVPAWRASRLDPVTALRSD